MKLVKACEVAAVKPGEMLGIEIDELPPVALYNVAGEFFATSNICTHSIAMLTDGFLEGDVVECPLHGGCFNVRTGAAASFPCEAPLRIFRVEVHDGMVFIEKP